MSSLFARFGPLAAAAALALPACAQSTAQVAPMSPVPGASQTASQTFAIWPGVAPGSERATQVETISRFPGAGFEVVRNVTRPTLEVFRPEPGKATGAAIVIAPGGGFRYLTMQAEGADVARALTAHGVTVFVLKYRTLETPADDGQHWREFFVFMAGAARSNGAFNLDEASVQGVADGVQALRLVRQRAAEFQIDPARVGMIGFSAGARVTAGALLDALIVACEALGLRQMVAVIGDSDNAGSIALHRARGFADAGVFKAAGWKHDDWRDVVFMQRELGAGGQTPPDAPGLPLVDKKPAR